MKRLWFLIALIVLAALPVSAAAEVGELGTPLAASTFARSITAGPDGNIWFSAENLGGEGGRVVGRVPPEGDATEYKVPGGTGIAAGADGNLWFGEVDGIGRITPAGEVTSFRLPAGKGTPGSLVAGPDGNVWFTVSEPAAIGYITPSGSTTLFPLRGGAAPTAITAGPAGDLWFTETKSARIGRITVAGEVTQFKLPDGSARPESIALGADGDLWFNDSAKRRVGRITPAGEVTFFAVPTVTGTDEVVAGPGGLIYFTARYEIGTINAEGKVGWSVCFGGCEYPPVAMTMGSDGRLWIASGEGHCAGYCGGGTELSYIFGSTSIGTYSLPPTPFGIGARVDPVQKGKTGVVVGCGEAGPCVGTLRLGALVNPPGRPRTTRPVGQVSYSLAPGEIKKLTVPISARRFDHARYGRDFLVVSAIQGGVQVGKRGFYFTPAKGGDAKQF